MTFPTRHRFVAPLLLASAALFSAPAAAGAPNFWVPFTCDQDWIGATDPTAETPEAIEFTRPSSTNETVYPSAAGTVIQVRDLGYGTDAGRYIIIDHGNGWTSLYANLASFDVAIGEFVNVSQPIATVGKSSPYESYLYFEQRYQGMPEATTFHWEPAHYWGSDVYASDNCLHGHF